MNEQWLWEQCELQLRVASDGELRWFDKGKEIVSPVDGDTGLPCIDLNNLFKYAVPLLERKLGYKEAYMLLIRWITEVVNEKDPADSLFQAIYKAFGGK